MNYGGVVAALLTNLSETFDCILYENALIAKIEAFPFKIDALDLVYDYLSHKKLRHSWKDIKCGVAKGSFASSLLFSIHLCDLLYFLGDPNFASYTDVTPVYTVNKTESLFWIILLHYYYQCDFLNGSISTLWKLAVTKVALLRIVDNHLL